MIQYVTYQDTRSNGNNMWYGRAVHPSTIRLQDLADRIARNTSNSRGEVLGIIRNFENVVQHLLLNSYKVQLGPLGILRLSFKSKPAATEEAFNSRFVTKFRLKGYMDSETSAVRSRAGEHGVQYAKAKGGK